MLILALGYWVAASVLLGALFAVCAWFTERHPHALDWVLGSIHEVEDESLEDELARWTA